MEKQEVMPRIERVKPEHSYEILDLTENKDDHKSAWEREYSVEYDGRFYVIWVQPKGRDERLLFVPEEALMRNFLAYGSMMEIMISGGKLSIMIGHTMKEFNKRKIEEQLEEGEILWGIPYEEKGKRHTKICRARYDDLIIQLVKVDEQDFREFEQRRLLREAREKREGADRIIREAEKLEAEAHD